MKHTLRWFSCLVALYFILFSAPGAYAYPRALCSDRILDSGEANGIFIKMDEIENSLFAVIKIGEEEWYLAINYDQGNKYDSLKGKPVIVKYALEQYWDDHDDECVRQEQLVSLTAAN